MMTKESLKFSTPSGRKLVRNVLCLGLLILVSLIGFIIGSNFNRGRNRVEILLQSPAGHNITVSNKTVQTIERFSEGLNTTHIWSLRLADENYFRLADLLPCRIVEYKGGPNVDTIDSCNHSKENEFSTRNTLLAQTWLYKHQHPADCANKRFAIIENFAWSGFGSTLHQVVWAFGKALADDRIAVYQTPGDWIYGDCSARSPDCFFLPITNCSIPSSVTHSQVIRIKANIGHWSKPILPVIFQNRTFNWYRAQLLFYLLRFNSKTLNHVKNVIEKQLGSSSTELYRPYISVYVRRSDKVVFHEMSQAYTLKQYFELFDAHTRKANITNVFLNSEDPGVFKEFSDINEAKQNYYKLLRINVERNVVFRSLVKLPIQQRGKIVLDFLTGLFMEVHGDLHAGTLTSNWCRLVDEIRLVLGKTIPYYTPENRYLMDM